MAARAVLLTVCAVALGACGSDEPRVSSAEYLAECAEQLNLQDDEQLFDERQVAAICKCTQDRLVERGDGDKRLDDASLDDGEQLGRECALEVLEAQ